MKEDYEGMVIRQGQLEDLCLGKDVEVLSRKELGLKECQGEVGAYWPDNVRIKKLSELLEKRGKRRATREKLRKICKEHLLSSKGDLKKLQKRLICHIFRKVHDKHRIKRDLTMADAVRIGFNSGVIPRGK